MGDLSERPRGGWRFLAFLRDFVRTVWSGAVAGLMLGYIAAMLTHRCSGP